jgi:predicted ATPase
VLLRRVGDEVYARALAEHHEIIRSVLVAHGGREVSTEGDAFFAVFSSPRACVAAAAEMQRRLAAHEWPAGAEVRVRMGVHVGEASGTASGDFGGFEVHRAARVAAAAHGGQVVLSATATALVRDALPRGAALRDLGFHRLKDLGHPEQIFQLEADGLERDFPPLRSLANPALQTNLPAQRTSFVGREREIAELRDLVGSSWLVTLTGPGGSGKTRLALQVAAQLLDGPGDGVWFVDLAPLEEPDLVPSAVASVLRVREEPGRSLTDTLCLALADRSLLLIMDNCEHLIEACAKLVDALGRSCPRLHVLVTSREPLAIDGERVHLVPPFSVPPEGWERPDELLTFEAVALFYERARAHHPSFAIDGPNGAAVASICRRLDGIPLAIELAAARMRTMSVSDIAERLHDRFRLLTGGTRTAVPRQQTLQTLIDWSYALLNPPERTVLARLSAFSGGFDLAAAEAVAGAGEVDAFEVVDLVSSLVDKSLVQAEVLPTGRSRYRLLETVREYAGARLAASGDERPHAQAISTSAAVERRAGGDGLDLGPEPIATRWRQAAYFLSLAEELAPRLRTASQLEAMDCLNLEIDNLRAALETFQAHAPVEMLRLLAALGWYWPLRGHLNEGRSWYDQVPPHDVAQAPDVRASLATATIMSVLFTGDLEDGARKLSDLEALVPQCRERERWEAWTMTLRAFTNIHDHLLALPLAVEATERLRRCSDQWEVGAALTMRGEVERVAGNIAAAEPLYQEALTIFEPLGDRFWLCVNLLNLGECAVQLGQYEAAVPYLASSLRAAEELGNEFIISYCALAMGCAAAALGQSRAACVLLGAALGWLDRRSMRLEPVEQMMVDNALALLRTAIGRPALDELMRTERLSRPEEALARYLHGGVADER